MFGLKLAYRCLIKPERKRRNEARPTTIERGRLHYFDARNSRKIRKLGGVVAHPREYNRRNLARAVLVQCDKKVQLVVVTADPKAARDGREGNPKRRMVNHRTDP